MKYFSLLSIALVFHLYAPAQFAVIDSRKIMNSMTMLRKADSLVEVEKQRYQTEWNNMQSKAEPLFVQADSLMRSGTKDTALLNRVVQEARKKQTELTGFQQQAAKKLQEYKNVLVSPYIEKINAVVARVSRRLKYSGVIDLQQLPLAWVDEKIDITDLVIKEVSAR